MENVAARTIAPAGAAAEYPKTAAATAPRISPVMIPRHPPTKHRTTDSMINCNRIELFFAPSAFRVSILRVRSVMDSSMIFMTPIPPTNRDIPAIKEMAIETVEIMSVMDSVMDSIVEVAIS